MSDHVALVIGAGTEDSIGEAVSTHLGDSGATVIRADISSQEGDGKYTLDASNEAQVDILMSMLKDEHGHLDTIVNSAGINYLGPTPAYSLDMFRATLDANLISNFLLLKHFHQAFEGNGRPKKFVAITSDTGMIPKSSSAAYASSKAGANQLIRAVAREYNKYSDDEWLVTALAPGRVATGMDRVTIADVANQRGISEEAAEGMLNANIPAGRAMTPDEAADWVLFLLTSGSFATGNVIRVDGGQLQG